MFSKLVSNKMIVGVGLIAGCCIVYPNLIELRWELSQYPTRSEAMEHFFFSLFRYAFFCVLTGLLFALNMRKITTLVFHRRLLSTLLVTLTAYGLYIGVALAVDKHVDCFTGLLLFQFSVACLFCTLTGHVYALYTEQRRKEREIEQLRIENLQSRCDALVNQINPHFFFNSLNSLTYLIREEDKQATLEYVSKLSGVFRYILQSEKKGVVALEEELAFLESFRYLLEVRFADKISFRINIPEDKKAWRLPVLSLLPLVDNIVVHNVIDSKHKMEVAIALTTQDELVVTNPIYPKLELPVTNGTGLPNLESRFLLLMNSRIRVEQDHAWFRVYIPLKKP